MDKLLSFALELAIPLLLGIAVSGYLRGVTARLLVELCGTEDRSEFWVRVSAVLTVAAPTVLVLVFGHSGIAGFALGETVRRAVSLSLVGIVVAVGFLARTIWKSVPVPPSAHPAQGEPG